MPRETPGPPASWAIQKNPRLFEPSPPCADLYGGMNLSERFLERALVYRCRDDGDRAAFDRLVTMHHPALIYYVRTLVGGGAGSAEGAVQEVWLAVHRQLGRLKEVAAFKS